jgi:hypothetical protein
MSLYEQLKTLSNRVSSLEGLINNQEYDQLTASFFNATQLTASYLKATQLTSSYTNATQLTSSFTNAVQLTASYIQATQLTASQGIYSNDNIILAADKGISFSDDSNNIGMTSELFDDYEIGTWTPTSSSFTTTGTVSTIARYIKIGRLVFIMCSITATSIETTAGTSYISGIPFASSLSSVPFSVVRNDTSAPTSYGSGLLHLSTDRLYVPTISPGVSSIVLNVMYHAAS